MMFDFTQSNIPLTYSNLFIIDGIPQPLENAVIVVIAIKCLLSMTVSDFGIYYILCRSALCFICLFSGIFCSFYFYFSVR